MDEYSFFVFLIVCALHRDDRLILLLTHTETVALLEKNCRGLNQISFRMRFVASTVSKNSSTTKCS